MKNRLFLVRFSANFQNSDNLGYRQGYEAIDQEINFRSTTGIPGGIVLQEKLIEAEEGFEAIEKFQECQND